MGIPEFIERCDRYCLARGVSRVWLSKKLLGDTYWLGKIADGRANLTVKRFGRAIADLEKLETEAMQAGKAA